MDLDNFTRQVEEVEALSAIYGNDWMVDSESSRSFSIKIKEKNKEVLLSVTMPPEYPDQSPPKYELSAPWMDRMLKETANNALNEVYLENIGETVIYQWVEKIREIILAVKSPKPRKKIQPAPQPMAEKAELSQLSKCPEITHGEVIVDRKSSFQGHAAEVHSMDDIKAVISKLKENKKIQHATHNMYAYRFEKKTDKGVSLQQDCDDDGEAHAGGRMLHLLQILDQKNALVMVSRWYGGIQLGPDRFRHINNATRQVLQHAGLLKK